MKNNKFFSNLKKIRKEKKLSQSEVARRMGVTRQRVNYIENGGYLPTLTNLKRLAKALDVDIIRLIICK